MTALAVPYIRHRAASDLPTGRAGRLLACGYCLVLLVGAGCSRDQSPGSRYAQRDGAPGLDVGGTQLLSRLFQQAGHRVTTHTYLSDRLRSSDVIVWFPDRMLLPDERATQFFEQWLAGGESRTLVYVGRDYDPAIDYWQSVRSQAAPSELPDLLRHLAELRGTRQRRRLATPPVQSHPWGRLERAWGPVSLGSVRGPWASSGADAVADQVLNPDRMTAWSFPQATAESDNGNAVESPNYAPATCRAWLQLDNSILVGQLTRPGWTRSRIILVADASFLLNLPLTRPAARQLAARLVRACGTRRRVAFLQTGPSGPRLVTNPQPSAAPLLTRQLVLLALQWLLLGIVFCLAAYPIFGRPRQGTREVTNRFDQHIESLGQLLQQTGDVYYARQQIRSYREWSGPSAYHSDTNMESEPTPRSDGHVSSATIAPDEVPP